MLSRCLNILWYRRQDVDAGGTVMVRLERARGDRHWDIGDKDKWFIIFR